MRYKIGFSQALELILNTVRESPPEKAGLDALAGRILAEDILSHVDSPSVDASLKEGYAVCSADIAGASPETPVVLKLTDSVVAGGRPGMSVLRGTAVKVTTGACLPSGADAVLAAEFTTKDGDQVICVKDAGPGRNILYRGTDVSKGEKISFRGDLLHPALIGRMAAAGISEANVFRLPRVAVIGTGDEVVFPGMPLVEGKLYASNIVETISWLTSFGIREISRRVVPDNVSHIARAIEGMTHEADAFITSGGAWGSERDLVLGMLKDLGWEGVFHRVRLGPGKAAGFGLLDGRPFFILPGGPPSHEAAFLLLALPGIMAIAGWRNPVFPQMPARLETGVSGQSDWTQVVHVRLRCTESGLAATPLKTASRLSSMAEKDGLLLIPEGCTGYESGTVVPIMILNRYPASTG